MEEPRIHQGEQWQQEKQQEKEQEKEHERQQEKQQEKQHKKQQEKQQEKQQTMINHGGVGHSSFLQEGLQVGSVHQGPAGMQEFMQLLLQQAAVFQQNRVIPSPAEPSPPTTQTVDPVPPFDGAGTMKSISIPRKKSVPKESPLPTRELTDNKVWTPPSRERIVESKREHEELLKKRELDALVEEHQKKKMKAKDDDDTSMVSHLSEDTDLGMTSLVFESSTIMKHDTLTKDLKTVQERRKTSYDDLYLDLATICKTWVQENFFNLFSHVCRALPYLNCSTYKQRKDYKKAIKQVLIDKGTSILADSYKGIDIKEMVNLIEKVHEGLVLKKKLDRNKRMYELEMKKNQKKIESNVKNQVLEMVNASGLLKVQGTKTQGLQLLKMLNALGTEEGDSKPAALSNEELAQKKLKDGMVELDNDSTDEEEMEDSGSVGQKRKVEEDKSVASTKSKKTRKSPRKK